MGVGYSFRRQVVGATGSSDLVRQPVLPLLEEPHILGLVSEIVWEQHGYLVYYRIIPATLGANQHPIDNVVPSSAEFRQLERVILIGRTRQNVDESPPHRKHSVNPTNSFGATPTVPEPKIPMTDRENDRALTRVISINTIVAKIGDIPRLFRIPAMPDYRLRELL